MKKTWVVGCRALAATCAAFTASADQQAYALVNGQVFTGVDLEQNYLMPGMMDAHTHLQTLEEADQTGLHYSPPWRRSHSLTHI